MYLLVVGGTSASACPAPPPSVGALSLGVVLGGFIGLVVSLWRVVRCLRVFCRWGLGVQDLAEHLRSTVEVPEG